jgi:hypothetical protein
LFLDEPAAGLSRDENKNWARCCTQLQNPAGGSLSGRPPPSSQILLRAKPVLASRTL